MKNPEIGNITKVPSLTTSLTIGEKGPTNYVKFLRKGHFVLFLLIFPYFRWWEVSFVFLSFFQDFHVEEEKVEFQQWTPEYFGSERDSFGKASRNKWAFHDTSWWCIRYFRPERSRAHKPWSAHCELKHWNFRGWKCLIHGLHFTVARPPLIHGLCAFFASNSRFLHLFQAALDTCLDSPLFTSLSVHGLHFTVYAPSKRGHAFRSIVRVWKMSLALRQPQTCTSATLVGVRQSLRPKERRSRRAEKRLSTRVFFCRVCFFSAPLRFALKTPENLEGAGKKQTLQKHPFYAAPIGAFFCPEIREFTGFWGEISSSVSKVLRDRKVLFKHKNGR